MVDKIYHNITIPYNDAKLVSDDRNTSLAETTVQLMDPLVSNTGVYDICISKFRIDTQTIPLVIPELLQPQTTKSSIIELNYWVKLISPLESPKTDITKHDDKYITRSIKYLCLTCKNFDMSYNMVYSRAAYINQKPVKKNCIILEERN